MNKEKQLKLMENLGAKNIKKMFSDIRKKTGLLLDDYSLNRTSSIKDLEEMEKSLSNLFNFLLLPTLVALSLSCKFFVAGHYISFLLSIGATVLLAQATFCTKYNNIRIKKVVEEHKEKQNRIENTIKSDVRVTINRMGRTNDIIDDNGKVYFKKDPNYSYSDNDLRVINNMIDKLDKNGLRKVRNLLDNSDVDKYLESYNNAEKQYKLDKKNRGVK